MCTVGPIFIWSPVIIKLRTECGGLPCYPCREVYSRTAMRLLRPQAVTFPHPESEVEVGFVLLDQPPLVVVLLLLEPIAEPLRYSLCIQSKNERAVGSSGREPLSLNVRQPIDFSGQHQTNRNIFR